MASETSRHWWVCGRREQTIFLAVELFPPWSSSVRITMTHEDLDSRTLLGKQRGRSAGEGEYRDRRGRQESVKTAEVSGEKMIQEVTGLKIAERGSRRDVCPCVHSGIILHSHKTWKQLHWPPTDEWMNRMWSLRTMPCGSALNRKTTLMHAATWKDLADMTLSEISRTEKDTLYESAAAMRSPRQPGSQRQKVELWLPEAGEKREWGVRVQWVCSFSFARWQGSEDGWWRWSLNNARVPNATAARP